MINRKEDGDFKLAVGGTSVRVIDLPWAGVAARNEGCVECIEGGATMNDKDKQIAELRVELEKLQAVFSSLAPTNSKAYEGLLGTGQALIDKDKQIADLRAELDKRESLDMEESQRRIEKRVFERLKEAEAERDQLKAQLERVKLLDSSKTRVLG